MTPALLIKLLIVGSMFLVVFALGLKVSPGSVLYLFRHERLLLKSVLAMNIIMLALVVEVGLSVSLPLPIKIALGTLAVSPVPPILPFQQEKAGGSPEYSIGLLAASALIFAFDNLDGNHQMLQWTGAGLGARFHGSRPAHRCRTRMSLRP